jgi:uncharacterized SAM-binding protein YcdF (DUF218 family)
MWFAISYGFLAPPTIFIVLCLLGPLTALVWRRTGLAIALVSGVCLFAAATPALSSYLMRHLEAELPEDGDLDSAQAIVLLGGDVRVGKGVDDADELGPVSLERVIYAVAAYRRLHKPIAISGGMVGQAHQTVGTLMKDMLETDFGIPVAWNEVESETTWENAVFTARLLLPAGIKTVVVVTRSPDLPRALWCFERAGLKALPWPAPRSAPEWEKFDDFMPKPGALLNTFYALHEIIGADYYLLRYGPGEGGDRDRPTTGSAAVTAVAGFAQLPNRVNGR